MKNYEKQIRKYEDFFSIKPSKIVFYTKELKPISEVSTKKKRDPNAPKLERKFHNFIISPNSQRNIEEKIGWLWRFSKGRYIKQYDGKEILCFRAGFISLTLPSKQKHPTSEIIEKCFSPLITLLRNHLKMTNFVWKLEFQENGNAHFHLISDTYIDYFYIRSKWNEKLKKLGYIDDYQDKFKTYNLTSYLNEFCYNCSPKFAKKYPDISERVRVVSKWYANGVASNWRNPNTADVRSVQDDRAMSWYLKKYLSKQSKAGGNPEHDNEENSFGIRLCYWSHSLSKCKGQAFPTDFYPFNAELLRSYVDGVVEKVYDYCRVFYLNFSKMETYLKGKLLQFYANLRAEWYYIPAYA